MGAGGRDPDQPPPPNSKEVLPCTDLRLTVEIQFAINPAHSAGYRGGWGLRRGEVGGLARVLQGPGGIPKPRLLPGFSEELLPENLMPTSHKIVSFRLTKVETLGGVGGGQW